MTMLLLFNDEIKCTTDGGFHTESATHFNNTVLQKQLIIQIEYLQVTILIHTVITHKQPNFFTVYVDLPTILISIHSLLS